MEKSPNPKPSLFSAVAELEEVCQEIDNSVEIGQALTTRFNDLRTNVSSGVDRCIWFRKAIASALNTYKETADVWKARVKSLERIDESFDNYLIACIQGSTSPLRGSEGDLVTQKNPQKVVYNWPFLSKSYDRILDPKLDYNIPMEYLEEVMFLRVNGDAVRKALDEGKELGFAKLEQGLRVRWSVNKKIAQT